MAIITKSTMMIIIMAITMKNPVITAIPVTTAAPAIIPATTKGKHKAPLQVSGVLSVYGGNFPCPVGNRRRAALKSAEEINFAMEAYADMVRRICFLHLKNRYDTEDVFMYLDPPYLHGTRKNYLYKYEMSDRDHEELLRVLVKHPGKILLSGYENEMYNDYLSSWSKVQKDTNAENGLARTETLWMNYDTKIRQISLFDQELSREKGRIWRD